MYEKWSNSFENDKSACYLDLQQKKTSFEFLTKPNEGDLA